MGRVGSALDNAAAEAFNSTIKVEYIHRHRFTTRTAARLKISTWIVDFYNLRRRHSTWTACHPSTTNDSWPKPGRAKPLNETLHDSGGLTSRPPARYGE